MKLNKTMYICSMCHGMHFKNLDPFDDTGKKILPNTTTIHHKDGAEAVYCEETDSKGKTVRRYKATVTYEWKKLSENTLPKYQIDETFVITSGASKIQRITRKKLQETNPELLNFWENLPSQLASYHMLMKCRLFRAALDWLTSVGPGMFLMYGCTGCHLVALLACGWYLCNVEWDDENGDVRTLSNRGQIWRCANCLLDYHGAHRDFRVLVLTAQVWGQNHYFYYGGDRKQGLKESQVIAKPMNHPLEAADLLFDMVKGMVL